MFRAMGDGAQAATGRRWGASIAELKRKGSAPANFSGVIALSDGRGLEFQAVPGMVPDGGTAIGAPGTSHQ